MLKLRFLFGLLSEANKRGIDPKEVLEDRKESLEKFLYGLYELYEFLKSEEFINLNPNLKHYYSSPNKV